jgi:integrase
VIVKRQTKTGKPRFMVRVWAEGRWQTIGTFATAKEAKVAEGRALEGGRQPKITCKAYAERFLRDYAHSHKVSSTDTARQGLKRFLEDFGRRPVSAVRRLEARDWAASVPPSAVRVVVTLFNQAVEDELIAKNPFRGLGRRGEGRKNQAPPTLDQIDQLDRACDVHGDYATMFRALFRVARFTAMRPGELYALEWDDVDLKRGRIVVARRVYRGSLDTPKSGKAQEITLPPPARDALLTLDRTGPLVFATKTGRRFSQGTLSLYWRRVLDQAGLEFEFYLACRHFCAHYMLVHLGLPRAVVKEQMRHVDESLLDLYGHENVGALERIDAAYRQQRKLRAV